MISRFRTHPSARRKLLVALTVAATALVGSGSVVSAGIAEAAPPPSLTAAPPTSVAECPTGPGHLRVRGGHDGSDPNDVSRAAAASAEKKFTSRLRAKRLSVHSPPRLSQIRIDVRVHVITRDDGSGGVSKAAIKKQIAVLNAGFSGRTYRGSAPTVFRFATKSIDYTRNSDWYDWSDPESTLDPDDAEAKAALHRGGFDDLNLYITGLKDDLLGYATFPQETPLAQDGVVVLNDSLPGGSAAPYNEGDTATHEVGHWLGLFHTFENGCNAPGDLIADTPYQDDGDNIFACDETADTCPAPGRDPVHNFMAYGDDPCLDRFTLGQSVRMTLVWLVYRANRSLA